MAVNSTISSSLRPPTSEKDAKALQFIEETTRNDDPGQERVLAEILSRNADTEYLRRFKLNGATALKLIYLCTMLMRTLNSIHRPTHLNPLSHSSTMALKKILSIVYIFLAITFLLNFQSIEERQLNYGSVKVTSSFYGDVVTIPLPRSSNNTRIEDKVNPRNIAPPAPQAHYTIQP